MDAALLDREPVEVVEQESGLGSQGSSGGEMSGGSSEETSSNFWSSSDYSEGGDDVDLDGQFYNSDGYNSDIGLHSSPMGGANQPPTTLHWVRMSSLRIHDNASLSQAMSSKRRFRAVFIVDPWFASGERKFGVNRWRFLLECLHDLDKRLKAYNTRLYVAKGHPVAVMEKLCAKWNVQELTFQMDREVGSHVLEEAVQRLAEQLNIKVTKKPGHTLYDTGMLLEKVGNKRIATIKDFKEVLHLVGKPDLPVEAPPVPLTTYEEQLPEEFQIPTLQDLGFSERETLFRNYGGWIGGETMALKRFTEYCNVRSRPTSDSSVNLLFDKTSLSPYIRFGCLSVRYFLYEVRKLAGKDSAVEPLLKDVTGKLLQREFYFTVAQQTPNFDCYDNDISFQLPWEEDCNLFALWKNGKTGYPWIDAAMRQLQREGWIHLCLRESVATFLTRGDLWISWVLGKDTFEELMLDFEVTVSSGCWMKSSCSAFIAGPVEHFCPVTYGRQIDPTGVFVRTFCPELKNFPDEYVYCPWTAPLDVQRRAGCIVGTDYPNPIIDHATAGFLCCEKLRSVMNMVHQTPVVGKSHQSLRGNPLRLGNNHISPHPQQLQQFLQLSGVECPNSTPMSHLHRYHPYTAQQSLGGGRGGLDTHTTMSERDPMLCQTIEQQSGVSVSRSNNSLLQSGSECNYGGGGSAGRTCSPCSICVSTDSLMSQLMSSCQSQLDKAKNANFPSQRMRRRTPPSNCSHKLANFSFIT